MKDAMEAHYRAIIEAVGEDSERDGLRDTPGRAARAMAFLTRGYQQQIDDIVNGAVFESTNNEIVIVRDIELYSLCEHHLLPFIGRAHVAYLPSDRVVGISKLARVVDAYARRLQTQETMTAQIARCIEQALLPRGVAVIIKAQHQCMTTRGVNKPGVAMVTRTMTGVFDSDPLMERRLMDLINA